MHLFEALWGSLSFVNWSSSGRSQRTRRFDAQEKVELIDVASETEVVRRAKAEVLPLLAERGVGNRKLRAAIESIELDQEALRMSSPLLSLRTLLATSSAAAVSGLATLLLASPSRFAA